MRQCGLGVLFLDMQQIVLLNVGTLDAILLCKV